jgi:hypothetical protein
MGTGKTVVITQVPSTNQLYYNNVLVTTNKIITNYNPDLLKIKYTTANALVSEFKFAYVDAAGKQDPTPGTYTIKWLSVLPVQKLELVASLNGTAVTVNWITENEINTTKFFVERSSDNNNFVQVNELSAAGNFTGIKNYNVQNDITALSGTAVVYYRIKLVNADGKQQYSNTAAVRLANISSVKTWPNPVVTNVNISLFSEVKTNMKIRIINAAGSIVYAADYNITKGNNQVSVNNLGNLPKGMYLLQLSDEQGNIQSTQKIIKD